MDKWLNKIINADCLNVMREMPDKSVDLVLTDPPYSKTANTWDVDFSLPSFWFHANRVLKKGCPAVVMASQPFASKLIMQNIDNFKWEDIWFKPRSTGHLNCKIMPLRAHESILVFAEGKCTYNPQITMKPPENIRPPSGRSSTGCYGKFGAEGDRTIRREETYPKSVITIPNVNIGECGLHPTQKPVALFKYLVKTFSNPNAIILDTFSGSGTTAIAATQLGRKFIGIEINPDYCRIAEERLKRETAQLNLFHGSQIRSHPCTGKSD